MRHRTGFVISYITVEELMSSRVAPPTSRQVILHLVSPRVALYAHTYDVVSASRNFAGEHSSFSHDVSQRVYTGTYTSLSRDLSPRREWKSVIRIPHGDNRGFIYFGASPDRPGSTGSTCCLINNLLRSMR